VPSGWLLPGLACVATAALAAALPAGAAADARVLAAGAAAGSVLVAFLVAARWRTVAAPPLAVVLGVALAARLLVAAGPVRFDDDVWRYLWDGVVTLEGVSPYRFAPSAVLEHDPELDALLLEPAEHAALARLAERAQEPQLALVLGRINFPFYPTLYPPTSQLAFAATAALAPSSARALRLLWALVDVGSVALLVLLLDSLGQPRLWALAYAWHPLPILELAGGGHQDALGIALLLASLLALVRGQPLLQGATLVASAGVKLFPLTLLALTWRSLGARGFAAFAAAGLLLGAPFLWLAGGVDLAGLAAYVGRWEYFSGPFALLVELVGGARGPARLALAAVLTAALLALRPWRLRTPAEQVAVSTRWIELLLILSPVVDPWYVPWALAPTVLRGSLAWPLFGLLVPLAYLPHPETGHSPWLRLAAWGPFLAVWVWESWNPDRPFFVKRPRVPAGA
jgi:Glycosyltransferase family 87